MDRVTGATLSLLGVRDAGAALYGMRVHHRMARHSENHVDL